MSVLKVGDVRELVAKAFISPEHVTAVAEALFAKGSVLAEKRKTVANKRKRKLPAEEED